MMNEQSVERITHTHPTSLGICDYITSHVNIAVFVKISAHDTSPGLYDRNPGIVTYKIYQPTATARYADIHIAHRTQHGSCGFMRGRQKTDTISVNATFIQHLMNQRYYGFIGSRRIRSALEHTGISTAETKRKHIERHVGARFINHTYHTKRHSDPT